MTQNHKQLIVYTYVNASIEGLIPSISAYVPGLGQSPDLNAHAFDIANIIVSAKRRKVYDIEDMAFLQLESILKYCKLF